MHDGELPAKGDGSSSLPAGPSNTNTSSNDSRRFLFAAPAYCIVSGVGAALSTTMADDPVFFELSWAILSMIGAANVFFGLLVVTATRFSPIAAVPLVTSTACAVANGLCFYAYYLTSPPVVNQAVAAAFADILWLVQEAGLSFYGYIILSRVLTHRRWYTFAGLFWIIMVAIVGVRINIAIARVRFIVEGGSDDGLQRTIDRLHMAYFPLIAGLECLSAFYLLSTFAQAKKNALARAGLSTGLFRYLMRSTEVRLTFLAVIGTMRAVTYSFQSSAQSATHVASQIDRFCYTMECLFPMVMYIDMLSSKLVLTNQALNNASSRCAQQARTPLANPRQFITNGTGAGPDDDLACPITARAKLSGAAAHKHTGTIEVTGGIGTRSCASGSGTGGGSRSSRRGGAKSCGSQDSDEHILRARGGSFATTAVASDDVVDVEFGGGGGGAYAMGPVGGINKTVEFELEVTRSFGLALTEEEEVEEERFERVETTSESSSSSSR